jgi:hypothetical protein
MFLVSRFSGTLAAFVSGYYKTQVLSGPFSLSIENRITLYTLLVAFLISFDD